MRTAFLILPAVALAAPDFVTNFSPAQLAQYNDTLVEDGTLELLKRQVDPNECANGYKACTNINQPGLCCPNNNVCSADSAGHAACCLSGAACTGTIAPITQGSSPTATGTQTTTTGVVTTTVTGNPTGTENPFVQGSGAGATSWPPALPLIAAAKAMLRAVRLL